MDLRCPVCGGVGFDEVTRDLATSHALTYGGPGRLGPKTRVYARACLTCGFVLPFVDLDRLRGKLLTGRERSRRTGGNNEGAK